MRGKLGVTANLDLGLGSKVRIGDHLVPRQFRVTVTPADDEHAPDREFTFEVRDDGVIACRELTLRSTGHGDDIRRTHLRAIDIRRFGLWGAAVAALDAEWRDDGTVVVEPSDRPVKFAPGGVRDSTPKRRRVDDDLLRRVADLYRADAIDGKPTDAVATALGVPLRTASRYVKAARDRGFLGAASVGKPSVEPAGNDATAIDRYLEAVRNNKAMLEDLTQ